MPILPLKYQFAKDFALVLANPLEMGDTMTFEIIEDGKPKTFTTDCVWDTHTLKVRPVVIQQGVYLGSVLWFVLKIWFKVEPKAEEVVYRILDRPNGKKVKEGWRVLDVTDAESVYEISLDRIAA
jgi:hypothetical protein